VRHTVAHTPRSYAVTSCVWALAKDVNSKHDVKGKISTVTKHLRDWVLSRTQVDTPAAALLTSLKSAPDTELSHAATYIFHHRRTPPAMLDQLGEFLDGARTAARAVFTASDVVEDGYRLEPRLVRQNAAFCVPLMLYFHDAFERRCFWALGRRYAFPFLDHLRRRTSGPKLLRRPSLTLVPRRTGNFVTFPAGFVARVLAEAAEARRGAVALRRLTCLVCDRCAARCRGWCVRTPRWWRCAISCAPPTPAARSTPRRRAQ